MEKIILTKSNFKKLVDVIRDCDITCEKLGIHVEFKHSIDECFDYAKSLFEPANFLEELSKRISKLGEVEMGTLDESMWLDLTINQHHLSFCFDETGNDINSIGLYKDVLQVVDQEQIWKVF